jgi:hypothetical protein
MTAVATTEPHRLAGVQLLLMRSHGFRGTKAAAVASELRCLLGQHFFASVRAAMWEISDLNSTS